MTWNDTWSVSTVATRWATLVAKLSWLQTVKHPPAKGETLQQEYLRKRKVAPGEGVDPTAAQRRIEQLRTPSFIKGYDGPVNASWLLDKMRG
jgi:hypothetical protein